MPSSLTSAPRPSLASVAESLGFRRIESVRLVVRQGRTTARVTGVLHRYPQTVPVSMATAERLVGSGAPLLIDEPGDHHGRGGR